MRVSNRRFPLIVLASLATPALLGGLLTTSPHGVFAGLIWGGFPCILPAAPRDLVGQLGAPLRQTPPFDVADPSTNVFWLARPSFRRMLAPQPTTRSRGGQRTACAPRRSWIPRLCSSARCGAYTSPGTSSRSRPSASRRSSRRSRPGRRRFAEPAWPVPTCGCGDRRVPPRTGIGLPPKGPVAG
jgi:hypothetical protein